VPDAIGRYQIVKEIGSGGMGVVYAAHDPQLDRQIAIKTIAMRNTDQSARERLRREARAAAGVTHPNICQVYEIGDDAGELFIAMELLEGESLASRLLRGAVPLGEALQIALSMLGGIEAIHHRGLVHRDVKPSNVFLTPHGVKVLDFGLARPPHEVADTAVALTLDGALIGTPAYMAPEQVVNAPVDSRTDLFSTAVVLFEMLAGRRPFAGRSIVDTLHAVVHQQPPALGGSAAVAATDRIVRRALSKRPEDRYQTATEMAEALRALLKHSDVHDVAPRALATTRLIVLPFRLLRPDPDIDFLPFGLADAIATSLSALESLVVRSSMTASRFDTATLDLKQVAEAAEVDAVLTGTLLKAGDRLRFTAQLVAAPDGTIIWSESSHVAVGDVFQLQDDLAHRIVESLALPLTAREHNLLTRDVPADPKAYELYLRANGLFYHPTDWTIARDLYEECLHLDPRYAPAWARLGRCHRLSAKFGDQAVGISRIERFAQADAAFRKALELNPDLPLAHNLYTSLQADFGHAADAMARLLTQANVRSSDPELFAGLVHACRYCGLLDASVAADERAKQLDPKVATSVAQTFWLRGDYEKAVVDPYGATGYICGLSLATLGRESEAVDFLRSREQLIPSPFVRRYLMVLRTLIEGHHEQTRELLDEVTPHNPDPESIYYISRTYARLGEGGRAVAELARAVDMGFFSYSTMVRDPWFDSVRGDERFREVLQRADERCRAARTRFITAGGERLLGAS
jgi:eukaryotic-like serine/threonine-protein kinase